MKKKVENYYYGNWGFQPLFNKELINFQCIKTNKNKTNWPLVKPIQKFLFHSYNIVISNNGIKMIKSPSKTVYTVIKVITT